MSTLTTDRLDQHGYPVAADPSSDTPRPPWHHLRGWFTRRSFLAALVLVLAVEVGLRVVEARNGVHGPQPDVVDEHARRMRAEQPDLVVVGSSSAGSDIWVPMLEAEQAACRAYVPWLASPTMVDVEAYVRREVLDATSP